MKYLLKIFVIFFAVLFVARIITVYVLYYRPFDSNSSVSFTDAITDTAKNFIPQLAVSAGVIALSYKWIKRKFKF